MTIAEMLCAALAGGLLSVASISLDRLYRKQSTPPPVPDTTELRQKLETLRADIFEKIEGLREEGRAFRHSTSVHLEQHDQNIDRNARAIENMFNGFNDKLNELKAEKSSLSMMLSNVRRPNG